MQKESNISVFLTVLCVVASLGTLTSATLVVAAYPLIAFIFPVLILPYIAWAGWVLVMRSMGHLRPVSSWLSIVLTIVAVPACAYLPYQIARQELLLRRADIPIHAGLQMTSVTADPFGNSMTGPGVIYRLDPQNGALEALRDLENQLVSEGWIIVAGGVPSARGADIGVLFSSSSGPSLGLRAAWNRTLHVYEDIKLRQNFSPTSPGLMLLVLLATGLISPVYTGFQRRKVNNESGL